MRVESTDGLIEALKTLTKNRILSAPVFDKEKGEYLGLIDILDLATLVTAMTQAKGLVDALARKEVDWYEYTNQELKVLMEEEVGQACSKLLVKPDCGSRKLFQTALRGTRGARCTVTPRWSAFWTCFPKM